MEDRQWLATFVFDGAGRGFSFSGAAPDCLPAWYQYGTGIDGALRPLVEDIVCHCLVCDNTAFFWPPLLE